MIDRLKTNDGYLALEPNNSRHSFPVRPIGDHFFCGVARKSAPGRAIFRHGEHQLAQTENESPHILAT